jgi:DUF4097 and DUF4098 domain-containing protein YvlB
MLRTFDIDGPAQVEVRLASGEIVVDPTLEGRIEVELTAHDDESQRLVDDARVELDDNRLIVHVPDRRGGFTFSLGFARRGVTCRIRCPRSSRLAARTKSADVLAGGTLGDLNVSSASGDTHAHEVTGGAHVQTASGDIDLQSVHGPVRVSSASGDVTIGEACDDVRANTVSGDQGYGAVSRGTVSAHSVSGDVTIGVRRGSRVFLDCSTVSGDTSSEVELTADVPAGDGPLVEIRAKTVSGDVRITRAPAVVSEEAA